MTRIYYSGAEIPGWRRLMAEHGIEQAAFSYMGLRRRTKFIKPWLIREKVKEPISLLLDSGAHTVNARPDLHPAASIMAHYESFVEANVLDVERVLEFDVVTLGLDARKAHRGRMRELAPGKFVPVWHAVDTVPELYHLAETYPVIGLAEFEKDLTGVTRHLRELARDGTQFIGLAMLKPDRIKNLPLLAVTGSSWLSPVQHGETVIYTGRELHRFHMKYQDTARTRYRTQVAALGLDPQKIADGDGNELLGLSLRSWEAFVRELVNKHPSTPSERNGEPDVEEPVTAPTETRHETRPKQLMPGLAYADVVADDGTVGERTLQIVDTTLRECNSCYLKNTCRAHEPDAECVFEVPELSTPQMRTLRRRIQVARVMFARKIEEEEGGMPSPVLSAELDRLDRMLLTDHKLDTSELTLHMRASGGAGAPTMGAGIISQIFGRDPAEMRAIEPVAADPTVSQILDVEFVEEPEKT